MMRGMRKAIFAFAGLQVASIALYRGAASLGYYAKIWRALPVLHHIPFAFAHLTVIVLAEAALIGLMTFLWYRRKPVNPLQLVRTAEHEQLERKSTLRWDLHTGTVNKALERAAVKTVAAFMNSRGGDLLLGVGDNGEAVGLEHDFATLPRKDADGFQVHFSNVLTAMLNPSLKRYIRLQPFVHGGKECLQVCVRPADRPAYVSDHDREEFFIRTGNGTTSLKISEANEYIASRFKKR